MPNTSFSFQWESFGYLLFLKISAVDTFDFDVGSLLKIRKHNIRTNVRPLIWLENEQEGKMRNEKNVCKENYKITFCIIT